MDTRTRLARLLRAERDRRALSQGALAAMSGVDQRRISSYERLQRVPTLDQVDQLLAGLGLQLRLDTEPLWAEVDATIDQLDAQPLEARLNSCQPLVLTLLHWLEPAHPIVDGAAAALLQGAPVPVRRLDLCILADDLQIAATVLDRMPPCRWNEEKGWYQPSLNPDPRRPGALRWRSHLGEFAFTLTQDRPRTITLVVGDERIDVRPLAEIEMDDPELTRVLARARERRATRRREQGRSARLAEVGERDGRRGGDVERVDAAGHRDPDV